MVQKLLWLVLVINILLAVVIVNNVFIHSSTQTPSVTAAQMNTICQKDPRDWRACYMEQFDKLTKSKDLSFVLKTLSSLQSIDQKTRDCHLLGHAISKAYIQQHPKDWHEFLTNFPANYCTGGFIHGTIEGLEEVDKNFVFNAKTLSSMCMDIKKIVIGAGGEQYCAHIMGHITLADSGGNIENASKVCAKVDKTLQYQCFSGMYMENITRDNLVAEDLAKHIPINNQTTAAQEVLCKNAKGIRATGCWREISHMYVVLANNVSQETYNLCTRADNTTNQNECFMHGVTLLIRSPLINSSTGMKSICNPVVSNTGWYAACVQTAVATLLESSSNYQGVAVQFCNNVEQAYRASCMQTVTQTIKRTTAPPQSVEGD